MKRLTLTLAAVLVIAVLSFAQESYTMYKVVYMKPDLTKLEKLGDAVKEHNKEYHNEAPNAGHIWLVNSGPKTGHWLYVVGPITYTEMDGIELGEDHLEHWIGDVLPNVKDISDGSFWRMSDKLTYEGTTGFTGKEVLTFFKIKKFEEYRFKAMVAKVKEVYEAKEYPNFFQVYYSDFSRKCGYNTMIAGGFENWAFFDNKPNFKADYEEVHGEGSFMELLEEYREVVENEFDEIITYVPELSADPAE
jgi:hypothetical protein